MTNEPMLMLALATIIILVTGVIFNGARKRRLQVRIETIPAKRLDNTPVRSEILGEMRVRERADALCMEAAADTPLAELSDDIATAETAAVSDVETETAHQKTKRALAQPKAKLSQTDLFPEEIQAPKVPKPAKATVPDLAIDRVVSVHVMATTQLIHGRHLLELLLQYGLRFGDMQIFHRHEHPTGQGNVLFSLAQAVEPGTFNIDTLERDLVPGVSFFMSLPGVKSTLAFDLMIDTARRLAHELQADLLDAQSQPLSVAVTEQWRDEVLAYERQHLQSL